MHPSTHPIVRPFVSLLRRAPRALPLLAAAGLAILCAAPRAARADPGGCTVVAHDPNSPTIQQAVDAGCSQIRVTPGTYHENVIIPNGDTVSITGVAGAARTVVDGGGNGSVFTVGNVFTGGGSNVTLTGLTLRNGNASFGGGINNNIGTVTLNNSTVIGNLADNGGGINNYNGTVTLNNSTVTGNGAWTNGGGIYNFYAAVTLNDSTVTGNSASLGGGIYNTNGTATVTNSAVSNNTAAYGGGIYNRNGTVALNNSTVTGNNAIGWNGQPGFAGGIYSFLGTLTQDASSAVIGNAPDDKYIYPPT